MLSEGLLLVHVETDSRRAVMLGSRRKRIILNWLLW